MVCGVNLFSSCMRTQARNALTPQILHPIAYHPYSQRRCASILSSLSDTRGSYNRKKRVGRGPASGRGKTSGRGHKGQKQHGKVPAGFTGGQTPEHVVKGKRGFINPFSLDLSVVNLDRIQTWVDQGRLDINQPITIKNLHESRCTHGIKDGVKLLAGNSTTLRSPINIIVSRASAAAIAAIEAAGGSVQTRYYTKTSIQRILKGQTHPTISLLSRPPPSLASPLPHGNASSSVQSPHATAKSSPNSKPNSQPETIPIPADASPTLAERMSASPHLAEIYSYRYRLPDPASRRNLEYYRDPAHRGYLAYQLKEGQGPSLFFKTPGEILEEGVGGGKRTKMRSGTRAKTENKIW